MPPTLRKPALAEEDGVDSGGVGGEACVISHQGLYRTHCSEKKEVDDGDDTNNDADQHGTAAERRPRQRRGPDESRVRLFGIIMICMMRRW